MLGFEIPDKNKRQTDSGEYERIFLWNWEEFRYSIALISPTALVLTFKDWYLGDNISFEQHVHKMEEIADCSVWMVRHGPNWEDYQSYY